MDLYEAIAWSPLHPPGSLHLPNQALSSLIRESRTLTALNVGANDLGPLSCVYLAALLPTAKKLRAIVLGVQKTIWGQAPTPTTLTQLCVHVCIYLCMSNVGPSLAQGSHDGVGRTGDGNVAPPLCSVIFGAGFLIQQPLNPVPR